MSYLIKTITSDVKVSTDIINSITGSPGLTVILGDNVCLDLQYGCYSIYIGKLDIFPLMCAVDKGWITELTLIHKNIM